MKNSLYLMVGLLLVCAAGCSGGGSGGGVAPTGVAASFDASGTPSSPYGVRLTATTSGDLATLSVVIGGQTVSADLYSFAFDLLFSDPSVVELIGSTVEFGTALKLIGDQESEAFATVDGNRIALGASKLGEGPGNDVATAEETIVSLTLRVRKQGATTIVITGSPPHDPEALDSSGAKVDDVEFDTATATLGGS